MNRHARLEAWWAERERFYRARPEVRQEIDQIRPETRRQIDEVDARLQPDDDAVAYAALTGALRRTYLHTREPPCFRLRCTCANLPMNTCRVTISCLLSRPLSGVRCCGARLSA